MSAALAFGVSTIAVVGAFGMWRETRDILLGRRARSRLTVMAGRSRAVPWLARLRDGIDGLRRSRVDDSGWAAWLEAAARSARSGASLREALVDGVASLGDAPVGERLRPFAETLSSGDPLGSAVDALVLDGTAAGGLAGRALRLAADTGGPAAAVLDALAATLHERAGVSREVRALATQARASALVMVAAPIVFAAGALASDPRVGRFLTSAPGLLCIALGVALDVVGAAWMSRLVKVSL